MTRINFAPQFGHLNFEKLFNEIPTNVDLLFSRFPKVDLMEDNNSVNIIVELPGVSKNDVKIVLENNVLTLSGEKKNKVEEKDNVKIVTNERTFGKFERKFELPEDINPDDVKANFENGLLNISIAKLVPETPVEKVIEIK
ncbi:MAG: Hsp20/alpha crystallin family protein [Ignavibacteriaceae bacterium]